MSEIVDRVATAIAEKQGVIFGHLGEHFREIWRDRARAAIEAMSEPTVGMIVAAVSAHNACPRGTGESPIAWAFQAAIREALK